VGLACRLNPRLRLAAAVDPNLERAEALAKTFRFRRPGVYASLEEALAAESLEAVYLGVPHDLHEPLFCRCVEARLPVLCEKPVAHSVESGERMRELSHKSGVKLGINYQYRYDPRVHRLALGVRGGDFGRLRLIRALVPWERGEEYTREAPWHASRERSGGGTLITQGSHALDAALYIAGAKAFSGYAVVAGSLAPGIERTALAIARLSNGAFIELASTMDAHPERRMSIEVIGDGGSARYEEKRKLRVWGTRLRRARPPAPGLHPLLRSVEGFRRWLEEGASSSATGYLSSVDSALDTLRLVATLYRSAESGREEQV
jgi:predicted dehydrogenase